jgi:hypothetical protein
MKATRREGYWCSSTSTPRASQRPLGLLLYRLTAYTCVCVWVGGGGGLLLLVAQVQPRDKWCAHRSDAGQRRLAPAVDRTRAPHTLNPTRACTTVAAPPHRQTPTWLATT